MSDETIELTKRHFEILDHTVNRASVGAYCGDPPGMQDLVRMGLMYSLGKVSWCPGEYFQITGAGRDALRNWKKSK